MSLRTYEMKRNPSTGKLERTGRMESPTYVPREGGGYSVENKVQGEAPPGSYNADTSLAEAKATEAAKQAIEEKKSEEKNTRDLKAAQTVTRQLNESAERTGSPNRYGLTGDEQGNIYIRKTITEQDDRSSSINRRDSNRASRDLATSSETRRVDSTVAADSSNNRNPVPGSKPIDDLTGFRTRINRIEEYEKRVEERSKRTDDFFRKVPGLAGDRYLQVVGRGLLKAPGWIVTEAPERVFIGSQKAIATIEGLSRKETRTETIQENKQAISATPGIAAQSYDPRRPEGFVNILLTGIGLRGVRGKAPKVEVTRSEVRTVEAELPGRRTVDASEGSFTVTAGKREFVANTETLGSTKPDAQGTSLRTENTQIVIREVKKGKTVKEYSAVARSDVNIKATPKGSKAKGTQTQVTNINDRAAVQESGRTVSRTRNVNEDVSVTRSYTETSKQQKVSPVKNPELVKYPENIGEPTSAQVSRAKTRKLVELQAPLQPKIAEASGIEVRAVTEPVRQTLSESKGTSISGKPVLKLAQSTVKTQKGLSVRRTESGKTLVNTLPSEPYTFKPVRTNRTPAPKQNLLLVEQTVRTPKTNPTASVQSQVKTAVTNIVKVESKARPVALPYTRQTTAQTRTEASQSTRQEPLQEPPFTTPRQRNSQESILLPAQKSRSKAMSDLGQKLSPARRQRDNQRQGQDIIQLPAQRQEQRQEQIQEPALEQVTKQRQKNTPRQTPKIPPLLETTKPLLPIVGSFGRSTATEEGYAVFVRREGKFSRVNNEALTEGSALKLGATVARNSAARSFEIRPTGGRARGRSENPNLQDFYTSKKERGVYIQKTKSPGGSTLNSAGEFREITAKGIRKKRGGVL